MISTVSMLGQAGEVVKGHNEFRYIYIESREPFNEGSFISKIPAMYWDRSPYNPFLRIPNGHFVVLFGRLESHPELGLYVLVEQMRHFPSNIKIKQEELEK